MIGYSSSLGTAHTGLGNVARTAQHAGAGGRPILPVATQKRECNSGEVVLVRPDTESVDQVFQPHERPLLMSVGWVCGLHEDLPLVRIRQNGAGDG